MPTEWFSSISFWVRRLCADWINPTKYPCNVNSKEWLAAFTFKTCLIAITFLIWCYPTCLNMHWWIPFTRTTMTFHSQLYCVCLLSAVTHKAAQTHTSLRERKWPFKSNPTPQPRHSGASVRPFMQKHPGAFLLMPLMTTCTAHKYDTAMEHAPCLGTAVSTCFKSGSAHGRENVVKRLSKPKILGGCVHSPAGPSPLCCWYPTACFQSCPPSSPHSQNFHFSQFQIAKTLECG